jgi:hypothetical protein
MRFTQCLKAAPLHDELIFRALADDGQPYEFVMTATAFMEVFAKGWVTARHLPSDPTHDESGLRVPAEVSIHVAGLRAHLALVSGPLRLLFPVDGPLMARLYQSVLAIEGHGGPDPAVQ